MEEMTAGSLFAAARGVDSRSGQLLDEQACLERGQFMSGACAGLISKVQKLESFHRELAEGPLLLRQPFEVGEKSTSTGRAAATETPSPGVGRDRSVAPHRDDRERVAITGMSILNALGKSPEEIWAASMAMKSGITLVPSSWWDQERFYDPRPHVTDKTYCKVGAFVDFHVSRSELGIPPQDFRTMTEATRITMWLADRAIQASGILESDIPRERIGGPHLPELRRGGGNPHQYHHPGIRSRYPCRHQKGRSPHAGSGERHRTGGEVRTHGPGRHHASGQTQLHSGRLHLQPVWVHGAKLFSLRRLRDLSGRALQRHADDPQRHHRCRHRRRG